MQREGRICNALKIFHGGARLRLFIESVTASFRYQAMPVRCSADISPRPPLGVPDGSRRTARLARQIVITEDGTELDVRRLLRVLQGIRAGDFSVRLPADRAGLAGKVADIVNEIAAANLQLAEANTSLQAQRAHELECLNDDLKRANEELERINQALQQQIAERARIEVALKEADRRKDEFLAILAHELRNPLAPIRNALTLLARLPGEDAQRSSAHAIIDRQTAQLTRLVDDLLDISRITSGMIKLAREPVSLRTVVERALEAAQPVIAHSRHELVLDVADEDLIVAGDLVRLVQMVGNLLNNAARYTRPGGRIGLALARDGEYARISVSDNGIGIPAESLTRLFQLFSRLESHERPTPDGLGVGLALVRKLVDMHNGRISVHSAGVDQGSEFVLQLPLLPARPDAPEPPLFEEPGCRPAATRSGPPRPAARHRILIADDNRDALDTLALLLEGDGHEVCKATDGAAALEVARARQPELILLDIGMPVMNGYDAARRVRAESWGQRVMLVALTGWGQRSDVERARAAGFDLHLVKPVTVEQIQGVVGMLADRPTSDSERA